MITKLFPTLLAKIMGGAVVVLLIALAVSRVQIGSLERHNRQLLTRLEVLTRGLTTCRNNTATLQAGIADQNAAVERQRAASAERVVELQNALTAASRRAQAAQSSAAAILARRPGADQCADALAMIRGE